MITIRREEAGDAHAIRVVNESAFGQPAEANLVNRLRERCPDSLSLKVSERIR
jgi:putative acetyltransferase